MMTDGKQKIPQNPNIFSFCQVVTSGKSVTQLNDTFCLSIYEVMFHFIEVYLN